MKTKTSAPVLAEHRLGPVLVRCLHDASAGRVSLLLIPFARRGDCVARRAQVEGVAVDAYVRARGRPAAAWTIDSLAQVKLVSDDAPPAFAQGRTLRNSGTVARLRLDSQQLVRARGRHVLRTLFAHPDGWRLRHELSHTRGALWLESVTEVENTGSRPITLEMLASFSLDGITPFASDDAPGRLRLHRFRSVWSMEGRLVSEPLEDLQLERSWIGWGVRCERFGAVGSMPVNGWFPRALLEDEVAGVTWGAQLAHNGSWQIEVYRRGDTIAFSGGLADREFGHWTKTLAPGESLRSPVAQLACVSGGADECCRALNAAQEPPLARLPRVEKSLPVIVNEWATTWGKPSHENMVRLATKLRGTGAKYLVMDAGWFAPETGDWSAAHGDWIPNRTLYPGGLKATADAIRSAGLIPGIWFEMETCGRDSALFHQTDLLLHRDGRPLTTGSRRHLDLRNPRVVDYLAEKVIRTLRDAGFGYLKIDYNDTIGLGPDGDESPGEGLRRHLAASRAFIERIREELPELVIENCASGGHRLEPSLFALTAMSSFSDAHESEEIPVIAANLHRLMLPRQSQVWAVLRAGESKARTLYSLAAGFLGRLCLSGDLAGLSPWQEARMREAISLYRRGARTIRSGESRIYGPRVAAYRHPEGWQAVVRVRADRREALIVSHSFARPGVREITLPLPAGSWRVAERMTLSSRAAVCRKDRLVLPVDGEWRGEVTRLVRTR